MPEFLVILVVPAVIALFAVFFVVFMSIMDTPVVVDARTSGPLGNGPVENR